jgi:hypothetical protein
MIKRIIKWLKENINADYNEYIKEVNNGLYKN